MSSRTANFMSFDRRSFIKWIGMSAASCLWKAGTAVDCPAMANDAPIVGVNAYYLLVEIYRKLASPKNQNPVSVVRDYLENDLKFFEICEKTPLNTLRFWAFNDYPAPLSGVDSGAFDGRLWQQVGVENPRAFEALEALVEVLDQTGLRLIPVLSNYWVSYGGILQYLVWSGELEQAQYFQALHPQKAEFLYLSHGTRFYTSETVEAIFRRHTSRVLQVVAQARNLYIIDIMNEPRGKNRFTLAGKPLEDGRQTAEVVAAWLNRQARWIKEELLRWGRRGCRISSGEEGWSAHSLGEDYQVLSPRSQYYEGIDVLTNLTWEGGYLDTGSVHLYPHSQVELERQNACRSPFEDRRGWGHLLRDELAPTPENFARLADEWIRSRGHLLRDRTWYLGEMGWCWPRSSADLRPQVAEALLPTRSQLYHQWTTLALEQGALGTCIWMLNGLQHEDEFYGLSRDQLIEILSRYKL